MRMRVNRLVLSRTRILCYMPLYRRAASCSLAAKALAEGSYNVVAHHRGNQSFELST